MNNSKLIKLLQVTTVAVTHRSFLLPFAKHFRHIGWQVDGAAYGLSECEECNKVYNQVFEVNWSRNPLQFLRMFVSVWRIRGIINSNFYDIIHVHTPIAAFLTRLAAILLPAAKRPIVVYTAHGFHFHKDTSLPRFYLYLLFEKLGGYWTDYLITINKEDEEAAKRFQIVKPSHVCYMEGIGVDVRNYSPEQFSETTIHAIRSQLKLKDDTHLLLMVAEFIPRKRHQDVILAFQQIASQHDVVLGLAGEGPLLPQIKKMACDLGIADKVRFLGYRTDIALLMRIAYVTLLVSEREGLPRSIMESLCLETPIIGSNIRGSRDLIEDGCGLLVDVGDVAELTQAMIWLLEHPDEASKMGRRGREKMKNYDIEKILQMHHQLYLEAIGQQPVNYC